MIKKIITEGGPEVGAKEKIPAQEKLLKKDITTAGEKVTDSTINKAVEKVYLLQEKEAMVIDALSVTILIQEQEAMIIDELFVMVLRQEQEAKVVIDELLVLVMVIVVVLRQKALEKV